MPRQRAFNVCIACHEHKIRCNIDAQSPCLRCSNYGLQCILRKRKQYSKRRKVKHRDESINSTNVDERDEKESASNEDQTSIVASAITKPSSNKTLIFAGEGGYGTILEATGNNKNRHFYVPANIQKSLTPEDLQYLNVKGCFTLPAESEDLIKAYFQIVHPSFPILDGSLFLTDLARDGLQNMNLLLLWSMFSISAGYITGITSCKVVKENYVYKAKLLYDLTYEQDKVVLIQAALLLSFWFSDAEDVKQSWYWSGIAFSIAQSLGLHRDLNIPSKTSPRPQQALWRCLWQCCMLRDAWLSFGFGRPLRLNEDDCSCPPLSASECQFRGLKLAGQELYTSAEVHGFEEMWQQFRSITHVLREALSARKPLKNTSEFCQRPPIQPESSLLLTLVNRNLVLCHNATVIARSRLFKNEKTLEEAASSTINLLASHIADGTTSYVAPTAIPLILPALLTYLTDLKSKDQSRQDLGKNRLNEGLYFLTMIENSYPAALILKNLLTTARDSLLKSHSELIDTGQFASAWNFLGWQQGLPMQDN